jgi:general stress protein 26
MNNDKTTEVQLEKVRSLLKNFRTAMMITSGDGGHPHARPMGFHADAAAFDGTLWFFSARNSAKMHEIGLAKPASLTFQNESDHVYLFIEGSAVEVDDRPKMEALYTPLIRTWFPKGLEDPNLTLIRFDAERIAYWDSPGGMLQVLAAFAKAVVTGTPGKGGESGEVRL